MQCKSSLVISLSYFHLKFGNFESSLPCIVACLPQAPSMMPQQMPCAPGMPGGFGGFGGLSSYGGMNLSIVLKSNGNVF
jgi:hypothetical protein